MISLTSLSLFAKGVIVAALLVILLIGTYLIINSLEGAGAAQESAAVNHATVQAIQHAQRQGQAIQNEISNTPIDAIIDGTK